MLRPLAVVTLCLLLPWSMLVALLLALDLAVLAWGLVIGGLISASLGPLLLACLLLWILQGFFSLPPLLFALSPILAALLCRLRQSRKIPLWLLWLAPLPALFWGPSMALWCCGLLVIVQLLAPGPDHAGRDCLTLCNTCCGQICFLCLCVLMSLAAPLLLLLPRRWQLAARLLRWGARCILRSPPFVSWQHLDERSRPAKERSPAVLLGNHTSVLDILGALACPGWGRCIVAKDWVFRSPVLALPARLGGMAAVEGILDAVESSVKGRDVLLFAEGTRTRDGRLQRLRRGAPRLARSLQRRLDLLLHTGTFRVLRPRQLYIRPGIIRSFFCDSPLSIDSDGQDAVFLRSLRRWIESFCHRQETEDLLHCYSLCDRYEACAHRGWSQLFAWIRGEAYQLARLVACLPDLPLAVTGDPSGVIQSAYEQLRPWHRGQSQEIHLHSRLQQVSRSQPRPQDWLLVPASQDRSGLAQRLVICSEHPSWLLFGPEAERAS